MDLVAATFIVRLDRSDSGSWSGVVERVRTGEKRRVGDLEAIGRVIEQMTSAEDPRESVNICQKSADTPDGGSR